MPAFEVKAVPTIAGIAQADWDRCFPGEAESWAFYHATELSGIPGFDLFYLVVLRDGRPCAAAPGFVTEYRIDTTVQGPMKRWTERAARWLPGLMSIRLACLGSPVAEICHMGFAPALPAAEQRTAAGLILQALEREAGLRRAGLVAIKDAAPALAGLIDGGRTGFKKLPGLPTALLPLGVDSLDAYLARLSRATRRDMRRKLRQAAGLRIERRDDISDVVDAIAALYDQTLSHSELRFEHLPPAFFSRLLEEMRGRAHCFLYWADDRLVAFNLVVEGADRLIDKYIGMNYADVPRYNLYFVSWMNNVDFCIRRGLPLYQAGQASYGPKLRLGCRLLPTRQYFRHRNPLIDMVLRLVSLAVRLDRFDPHVADETAAPEAVA